MPKPRTILSQLVLLPHGRLFASLYNWRGRLLGRPTRVAWNSEGAGAYHISDTEMPNYTIRIPAEARDQLFYAYNRGLKMTASYLARRCFLDHIKFAKGDVVLDCGANLGNFKLYFDLNKLAVQYIGFEPSPHEFACLSQNVTQGDFATPEIHNVGLWHKRGNLRFYVSSFGADSSFIQPPQYDSVLPIPTRPLADFIPQSVGKEGRVRLLKLEAEGAELEVLQGLGEKLGRIDYIAAAVGHERGIKQEATFIPVTNFLIQRGFEIVADDFPHDFALLFKNATIAG